MILSVLRWPKFVRSAGFFSMQGFRDMASVCFSGVVGKVEVRKLPVCCCFCCLIPHLSGEGWLLDFMRVHLLLFLLLVLVPRQLRSSTPSVLCRTSTAIICAQCSLPDPNRDHQKRWQKECQKICQKECQKKMSEEMPRESVGKNVRQNFMEYARQNVRKTVRQSAGKNVRRDGRKSAGKNVRRDGRKNVRNMSERTSEWMSEEVAERVS